jgi:hypothetical protein
VGLLTGDQMNIENDPNEDMSETFSLKPKTQGELVWLTTIFFAFVELEYGDVVEVMDTNGFLLNEKVYLALKTAAKTKSLINKVAKHLIKNYDIEVPKEEFLPVIEGIFKTLKKCFVIAEEKEIIIILSSEKIEEEDDDCCCYCGGSCGEIVEESKESKINIKYLN